MNNHPQASVLTEATGRQHVCRTCEKSARPRFTLIELLVVVAIISVLAAMLLPALSKARERGRSAVCINNIKQISLGLFDYSTENDGYIPTAYDWWRVDVPSVWFGQPMYSTQGLGYYVSSDVFYNCPSADWAGQVGTVKTTYGMNDNFLAGNWPPKPPTIKLERIKGDPTKKLVFIDAGNHNDLFRARMYKPGSGAWEIRKYGWERHALHPNFSAVDGHVESLYFTDLDVITGNNDWWRFSAP